MAISKKDAEQVKQALIAQFVRREFNPNGYSETDHLISSLERVDTNVQAAVLRRGNTE